jgi:magnesium transporter
MLTPAIKVKYESVKKLVRRNAKAPLEKLLCKLHHADIAAIVKNLNELDRQKVLDLVPEVDKLADIILELEDSQILEFLDTKEPKEIAQIINEMDSDDAADIIRLLDEDLAEEVMALMKKDEMEEVEKLLYHPEDSAGSIMNTTFVALNENITVKEATKTLHKSKDVEMVFYLYVVDDEGRLTGVISLRQLILNPPEKKLKEIAVTDVIRVTVDMDREDVARVVEKYDLLAVPVVDEQNKLVGIITVDDIIDIIREEATEDIYKMAGTSEDELLMGNQAFKIARIRSPWLFITFIGGLFSGAVVAFFEHQVANFAVLASFMPLIAAMGGNVSSQSATILIRGVALGKIDTKALGKVMLKEIRVGLIMGAIMGVMLALVAPLWYGDPSLGLIVGIAMFAAITFASFTGTMIPALLIKFNQDPAVASSPLLSMINDFTGLSIYFTVAIVLIKYVL